MLHGRGPVPLLEAQACQCHDAVRMLRGPSGYLVEPALDFVERAILAGKPGSRQAGVGADDTGRRDSHGFAEHAPGPLPVAARVGQGGLEEGGATVQASAFVEAPVGFDFRDQLVRQAVAPAGDGHARVHGDRKAEPEVARIAPELAHLLHALQRVGDPAVAPVQPGLRQLR
jgi:hypothetical protein